MKLSSTIHIEIRNKSKEGVYMKCKEFPNVFASGKTTMEACENIYRGAIVSLIEDVIQFNAGNIDFNILTNHLLFIKDFYNDDKTKEKNALIIKYNAKLLKLLMEYFEEFHKFAENFRPSLKNMPEYNSSLETTIKAVIMSEN